MTGLHRQVLYKGKQKQRLPLLPVLSSIVFSVVITAIALTPAVRRLAQNKAFLAAVNTYLWIIIPLLIITAFSITSTPLRKYSPILSLILTAAAGYLMAEIIYRTAPIAAPMWLIKIIGVRAALHLNTYFLHRLYHIFPLSALLGLYLSYPDGITENYLQGSDLNVKTEVFDKENPRTWKSIVIRFAVVILLTTGVLVFLSHSRGAAKGFPAIMIVPIALYAVWTCLVEETVFRGVFMGALVNPAGANVANHVQALLFAVVHYDPSSWVLSAVKIAVFYILGWFFGKATQETKGVGASLLMHTMLVTAIEFRLALL